VKRIELHLAPPILSAFWRDRVTGEPRKVRVGPWVMPLLRVLAKMKGLRGGALDVFGYAAERRMERQAIKDYEKVLDEIAARLTPATHAIAVQLARLPLEVKGFGHIKEASRAAARKREADLFAELRRPAPVAAQVAAE
jgi:indolepyruvate ferredoxin oxidoreductase